MKDVVVLHPGYATGDIWAVSAYMALNPNVRVAISHQRADGPGKVDKSSALCAVLQQTARNLGENPDDRVRIISLEKMQGVRLSSDDDLAELADVMTAFGAEMTPAQVKERLKAEQKSKKKKIDPDYLTIGPSIVTQHCAAAWKENADAARRKVRKAWGLDGVNAGVGSWLTARFGIPTSGRRAVVLWARWTGKGKEVKPEHDTSFQGLRDMVDIALKRPETIVIITGDHAKRSNYNNHSASRAQKIEKIVEARSDQRVFDLTEFWNGGLWSEPSTRFDQLRLWDFLNTNYKKCRHLGFRSGNLEALAMAGCTVRYLEEETGREGTKPPAGSHRMDAFNGPPINYDRLPITEVPTRTGQHAIKSMTDKEALPKWILDSKEQKPKKEFERESFHKGFTPEDKRRIAEYLDPDVISTPPGSPRLGPKDPVEPGFAIDTERQAVVITTDDSSTLWESLGELKP